MAFSESLAARIRETLGRRRGISEKRMFGGVGFLLHGNMLVGVWKTSLIARLGPNAAAQALKQPQVAEFDVTGRPMRGWVMIEAAGLESAAELRSWIEKCLDFVAALPRK